MQDTERRTLSLTAGEAAAVFAHLKSLEEGLDAPSRSALQKMERYLYDELSIDELESLVKNIAR